MLSDRSIALYGGSNLIQPFDLKHLQPASYDLALGPTIRLPGIDGQTDEVKLPYTLNPGMFVLASTEETITLSAGTAAQVSGRSTWGRRGLMIHVTAGFVDPGFRGQLTLELVNVGGSFITLHAGDRIAQISFYQLDVPAMRPYGHKDLGSHYQDQTGPTPARG